MFAVQIVAESFHRTWSLWLQAPILLAVVALTARPLWGALREIAWSRVALVLAVAAPLLVATLLPQREYHFAGHEGAYGELLDGALPETGDLSGHRTFAVPAGVAWAMGRVVPGEVGRVLWLVGNRASLALVVLLLCACAARLAGEGADVQRRAMRIAAVGVLATPALLGWSATAFFVVPALAMGAAALLLGLAGRPAAALAWGSLALASRMETAPLLFAGVIAVGWPGWKEAARGRAVAGLIGALSVLAVQAFTMSQKRSELPLEDVRPDPSVLLENLANLTLGGPWLAAVVILLVAVTLGLAPRRDGIAEAAVAIAAVIAVVQPIFLVDGGARHLLPAAALLPVLAAAVGGGAGGAGGRGAPGVGGGGGGPDPGGRAARLAGAGGADGGRRGARSGRDPVSRGALHDGIRRLSGDLDGGGRRRVRGPRRGGAGRRLLRRGARGATGLAGQPGHHGRARDPPGRPRGPRRLVRAMGPSGRRGVQRRHPRRAA